MRNCFFNMLGKGTKMLRMFLIFSFSQCLISLTSCSDDSSEEDEYANWEERNDAYINKLAQSQMMKIKAYTKDPLVGGKSSDYIYVEVLEEGNGTESPLFTDTIRVAYRGRLIPTTSYPEGAIFDQSYEGEFSWRTADVQDFCCGNVVNGFSTAMMHMHIGDRWRVHIPYQLGYGTSSTNSIKGYSNLIFEIALLDFWHPGELRGDFKARKQE